MRCQFPQPLLPRPPSRINLRPDRVLLLRWALALGLLLALLQPPRLHAQAVELKQLQLQRHDGDLTLEFSARLILSTAIEDALRRGVPLYFNARATVYRDRWYWRDERVARVSRTWRLA